MNSRVPHHYRVVFDGDLVAGIPKFMFMFKHAGVEVRTEFRSRVTIVVVVDVKAKLLSLLCFGPFAGVGMSLCCGC